MIKLFRSSLFRIVGTSKQLSVPSYVIFFKQIINVRICVVGTTLHISK
jgi:hypothetical protein